MGYKRQSPQPVIEGGTGIQSATTYAPIVSGTTSTGAFQSASTGQSNSGYLLTSTGASSLPSWQANAGGGTTGTFTPGLIFSTGSPGTQPTYASQLGEYYTIGNIVFYSLSVVLTSKGTQTGLASFTGLPLGLRLSAPYSSGFISSSNITFSSNSIRGLNAFGIIQPIHQPSGTRLTDANFANNSSFQAQGIYFTS
ncbi:MAG: hypothetical protein WCF77_05060 [Minisyncoccia bacterium]